MLTEQQRIEKIQKAAEQAAAVNAARKAAIDAEAEREAVIIGRLPESVFCPAGAGRNASASGRRKVRSVV